MATFKAVDGKKVFVGKKIVEFKGGTYSTEVKSEIALLAKAKGVAEVKGASKAS